MTLQQIAEQITDQYNLPVHELRRKEYNRSNLLNMKVDFVAKARQQGFTNKSVAEFMDYTEASASELYSIAMAGKDRYDWQKMLTRMLEGEAITKEDYAGVHTHADRIKEEGYNVFKPPEGYRI